MLRFFVSWLLFLGVPKQKIRARLHLYKDMDEQQELQYWSKQLGLPV